MYDPAHSNIVIHYFPQLLGIVYFFLFWPFLFQMKGLFGKNGILPINIYLSSIGYRLGKKACYYIPSLFWFNSSDSAIMALPIIGTIVSILLILGIYPVILLPVLLILHLSIISAGQEFLSFGWEGFLMEIGLYTFLLILAPSPNLVVWWALNLLLFRFHFEGGISKLLSRDVNWRNLTALDYHYFTQPLPNTQAFFFHKLPMWFQKFSCLLMFIIEIIVPFAIFGTEEMRLGAFCALFGLQFFIWLTGNFSYLNHMTAIFCAILISDAYLRPLIGDVPAPSPTPWPVVMLMTTLGVIFVAGQILRIWTHFSYIPAVNNLLRLLSPFRIVNRYGIFAVMTTKRYEVTIEGSDDGENWKEYAFKWKPSEPSRRPRRVSPYQPRLDWQVWFLPFTMFEAEPWFKQFLYRLLQGSPEVLKLLRHNPFPDSPPEYIRAVLYDYEYTSWKEWRKTGNWWRREFSGPYSPTFHP
jgi:lipase maturation factor 1